MTISVNQAAKILRKSPDWVRLGIKQGVLPFGAAVLMPSGRYDYIIYPAPLAELLGVSVEYLEEITNG